MDRKRRLMENNNGWPLRSQLFDGAPFRLPLLSTAVPASAATGTTATFTRATAKTWPNNDGYLVTGVAGEIGFVGARRVRNWIQAPTENWSSAGWAKSGISVSGNRLTATGANGIIYDAVAIGMGTGRTAVGSVTLSRVTGTGNIDVSTNGGVTWTTVSVTGARVSVSLTGNINGQFAIRIVTSGDSVDATYPQLEDVTAQTTQTAGEYVSVGVASAPYYHGSMVDGVKCFPTDLSGNPLTTLKGYLAEGAATNLCLQSNSLTTTPWADQVGTCTPTQNATGPNGGTTAWTLTDNDGAATEVYGANVGVLTAASYTTSIFVAKTSGAQSSYPVFLMYDETALRLSAATIDTTNGIATIWTSYTGWTAVGTADCVSHNDDFWRVSVTFTASKNAWVINLAPAGALTATLAGPAYDVTARGSAVFYGAQVELGSFASSYIPTTTIAVARNADVLTYSGGDVPNLKTLLCTFKRDSGVTSSGWAVALSDGTINNYMSVSAASGTQARFLGVAAAATQWDVIPAYTAGTTSKMAFSAAPNDIKMSKDGTGKTPDTVATVPTVTELDVGHVAGSFQLSGNVSGIYGWTRNLSQSELNAITAL